MARTYSDVITRARRIVQDEDAANYRYSDQSMLDAANDAVLEARRVRPDLFIAWSFQTPEVDLADIATTTLPIEEHYFNAMVLLTAATQMLRDDEFSLDSRAVNLMNKGTMQLLQVAS